ncbi:sulfite exporter TauE/SafE family protein [Virgibacillus necropolis]|uniref:Probable membrane transporter protein n=1 Tax=Virgibacillus necropolis TaxID=163877 RepID=A0A221MGN4_9BACI|nr:sulfite exporter TauE/SafE family protein [Virgibacillus necropolis]ASN06823.1 hypothetical protein CFK40_18250 [Virgibacillus necropolis]
MEITMGILLLFIGFFSGAYGIIVGAGGGFIFVPALLILFNLSPQVAAGTGLTVVLLNALSGVVGYVRQKRIDYHLGFTLSIGAVPGTFLGVLLAKIIPSQSFYWIFATLLVALGVFLLLKKEPKSKAETAVSMDDIATRGKDSVSLNGDQAKDTKNPSHEEKKEIKTKILILFTGVLLGTVSSFFGIGGGWLMVPILVYLFRVIPRYATATSIFALCLYSLVGVVIYLFQGNIYWTAVLWGGLGVITGAQIGVYLSNRISGKMIIQMLSILLIGVGIKLFFN